MQDDLIALASYFGKLSKMHPNEQPSWGDGCRPFSTGDVKHFATELPKIAARIEALEAKLAEKDALLRECGEALGPFAVHVDKSSCTITMIWQDGDYKSTYTGTLAPDDFFKARATRAKIKDATDAD